MLSSDESTGYERRETTAQALMIAGGIGYMAGGPTTQWLHDRKWQALGSFGMRGGLPELLLGAAAGAAVAMALDASLFAWEPPREDRKPQATLGLSPVLSSDGRRELRVFGTF